MHVRYKNIGEGSATPAKQACICATVYIICYGIIACRDSCGVNKSFLVRSQANNYLSDVDRLGNNSVRINCDTDSVHTDVTVIF